MVPGTMSWWRNRPTVHESRAGPVRRARCQPLPRVRERPTRPSRRSSTDVRESCALVSRIKGDPGRDGSCGRRTPATALRVTGSWSRHHVRVVLRRQTLSWNDRGSRGDARLVTRHRLHTAVRHSNCTSSARAKCARSRHSVIETVQQGLAIPRFPWWLKTEQMRQVLGGRGRVRRPLHISRHVV